MKYLNNRTGCKCAAGLMELDEASMSSSNRALDNVWRGAEAYHFWLLAHRQLYAGDMEGAMRTALQLRKYDTLQALRACSVASMLSSMLCRSLLECQEAC